jgi:hypothetical protein
MQKIKRKVIPKHILIPDTNVLWQESKEECVSQDFTRFWTEHSSKYEIELVLPGVVKDELLYQQTSSALTVLNRINKQFDSISSIANKKYKHRLTSQKVKDDVKSRLDSWVSSVSAKEIPTPIDEIDWKNIICQSIWRLPPFSESKDKKSEKGFRDALILESVFAYSRKKSNIDIAFVSDDRLLSSAIKERLKNNKKILMFESLEDFSSYLRLTDEKLAYEFVQAIQKRARVKFHSYKDTSCLTNRENIVTTILEKYTDNFENPSSGFSLAGALLNPIRGNKGKWIEFSKESVWIRAPRFLEIEDKNKFKWDSRIIFSQLFKYDGPGHGTILSGHIEGDQENLRKLEFKVIWRATVGRDARFIKMEVESIDFEEKTFEPATNNDRERYGGYEQEP